MKNDILELEKVILGILIMFPEVRENKRLTPNLFTGINRWIFETICKLHREGKEVDCVILYDELSHLGIPNLGSYIGSLLDGMPRTEVKHLDSYITRLINKKILGR